MKMAGQCIVARYPCWYGTRWRAGRVAQSFRHRPETLITPGARALCRLAAPAVLLLGRLEL